MDPLVVKFGGDVAGDCRTILVVQQDIHAAWDLFKLKDVQENTSVVGSLKTLWVVKRFAKNARSPGAQPRTNVL